MARVTNAQNKKSRKKKLAARASGFHLGRSNYRQSIETVMKAEKQQFVGRKLRKRDFRRLWNQRIGAAARNNGMNYSTFIGGLKKANIDLNRKMLAELAIHEPEAFKALVEKARAALQA